ASFAVRGRHLAGRFIVGLVVGLLPILAAIARGWASAFAGYGFWLPQDYDSAWSVFSIASARANAIGYLRALSGAGTSALYPFPVPALAVLGLWGARREGGVAPIIAGTAVLHATIALLYFFRDVRLLLPSLPLVIVLATSGLRRLAERRPAFAVALGVAVLVAQGEALARSMNRYGGTFEVGPTLNTVERSLPREGLVVSDVASGLAWLYWERGTQRTFMPLSVPPADLRTGLFTDRLL